MGTPRTLVVVTPRERLGHALPALERLLADTEQEHDLLYLDAFLPGPRHRRLRRLQRRHGFRRLPISRRATPNQARNRALQDAGSYDYVVFVDNDIDVERGWLRALVSCAEETAADVCVPLCLELRDGRCTVHVAGGEAVVEMAEGERRYREVHDLAGSPVGGLSLERRETGLAEFHCVLVRRERLDRLGPLDEGLPSLFEHGDLSLGVRAAGGRIWLEPGSVVTYVPPPSLGPSDLIYFRRRWSERRCKASVEHFQRKWGVSFGSPGLATAEGFNRWHRRLPLRLLKRRALGLLGRRAADA